MKLSTHTRTSGTGQSPTLVLLKILALGQQQMAAGKVTLLKDAVTIVKARRRHAK